MGTLPWTILGVQESLIWQRLTLRRIHANTRHPGWPKRAQVQEIDMKEDVRNLSCLSEQVVPVCGFGLTINRRITFPITADLFIPSFSPQTRRNSVDTLEASLPTAWPVPEHRHMPAIRNAQRRRSAPSTCTHGHAPSCTGCHAVGGMPGNIPCAAHSAARPPRVECDRTCHHFRATRHWRARTSCMFDYGHELRVGVHVLCSIPQGHLI